MRKTIDFPPYTEAEVLEILPDGSLRCNLFGERLSGDNEPETWRWHDTNIVFPPQSPLIALSEEELSNFEKNQQCNFI